MQTRSCKLDALCFSTYLLASLNYKGTYIINEIKKPLLNIGMKYEPQESFALHIFQKWVFWLNLFTHKLWIK